MRTTCCWTSSNAVWLVDFDRGRLRRPGFWCDGNLVRLRRSLEKITDRAAARALLRSRLGLAARRLFHRRAGGRGASSRARDGPQSPCAGARTRCCCYLALPVVHAAVVSGVCRWRARRTRRGLARLARRGPGGFGIGSARAGGGIWVHAVSVGEVQAAAILIAALRERDARDSKSR